jgi:uncharacterized protein
MNPASADSGAPDFPIIDAHVHFFPQKMMEAIWSFFEKGRWGVQRGRVEDFPAKLADHGVSRYTILNYVKSPGQAEALNQWTAGFAEEHPESIPFCTIHAADPDPWSAAAPYLEECGFRGVKIQPLVSEFGIDDPRLRPTLRNLERLGKILFAHAGTAPYTNSWLGLERLDRVMQDLPMLKVVLAHMGAYETEKAVAMVDTYPNLHLDTAMIFVNTELFDTKVHLDMGEVEKRADRILFGSDFPNFPYPYAEAKDSIIRLPLTKASKKKIFHDNAAILFGFK